MYIVHTHPWYIHKQIKMAVFIWYRVKSNLSTVSYCSRVHWTSHCLQCTSNTRPCLTGHPVYPCMWRLLRQRDCREFQAYPELNHTCVVYMLPAKWIRQVDPFRLAQISPAEWNQGWTQTFRPNIWRANMFVFPFSYSSFLSGQATQRGGAKRVCH